MKLPVAQISTHHQQDLQGALEWILAHYIRTSEKRVLLVCPTQPELVKSYQRLRALLGANFPIQSLPDVEYLPYDHYSPDQATVVGRLKALAGMQKNFGRLVLTGSANLIHRLPPIERLSEYLLNCRVGQEFPRRQWLTQLVNLAYYEVDQVFEPGQFSVRGDIVDLFVHGQERPYRIDTLDDVISAIRVFDPQTSQMQENIEGIDLAPAGLVPFDPESLARFEREFSLLSVFASQSSIYKTVLNRRPAQGIESYFPLFYSHTTCFTDLLGDDVEVILWPGIRHILQHYLEFTVRRYESSLADQERPLLPPHQLLLTRPEMKTWFKSAKVIDLADPSQQSGLKKAAGVKLKLVPKLELEPLAGSKNANLLNYLARKDWRCIVCSASRGKLNYQIGLLQEKIVDKVVCADDLATALSASARVQITVAPFEDSFIDLGEKLLIVAESVFGTITRQVKRTSVVDELTRQGILLNSLRELKENDPIIHPDHGVGRYAGIVSLSTHDPESEFIQLNYAEGDKLYVPFDQAFLLDRYHLSENEQTPPWHSLGSGQWRRTRARARKNLGDLASKIIAIHAVRQKTTGLSHRLDSVQYQDFCSHFPYQETPDQKLAIETILQEMQDGKIIDRLLVGEVGCGKTEVALRATFLSAVNGYQTVVLAPTTILCQQHYERFLERLAQWEIRVEILSRFNIDKHDEIRARLSTGKIDVLIATHAALSDKVHYQKLGLVIIDEEQRFGVMQKDKLKNFLPNVNVLKMTATPIPRTLQMALNGLLDLSIIATMPEIRRSIHSEILHWDDDKIRSICERELFRGGQVFIVNPRIKTLDRLYNRICDLLPDARVGMVHGQSPVRQIERAMLDFYHQKCDILVTTQIIENGVDFPLANTIIINDATAFGLSSLHQLRGRVGRSHIGAYAYFVVPPETAQTNDARDRLSVLNDSAGDGQGFQLAMADLELRGSGSPLGKKQSGHEIKIGYSTYMTELAKTLNDHGTSLHEIFGVFEPQVVDIKTLAPAYLPEKYIQSISDRLYYYRAIHYAADKASLYQLRAQLFERFGSLPPEANNLIQIAELKQNCQVIGVHAIACTEKKIKISFNEHHRLDTEKLLQWARIYTDKVQLGLNNVLSIRDDWSAEEGEESLILNQQVSLTIDILNFLSGQAVAVDPLNPSLH